MEKKSGCPRSQEISVFPTMVVCQAHRLSLSIVRRRRGRIVRYLWSKWYAVELKEES